MLSNQNFLGDLFIFPPPICAFKFFLDVHQAFYLVTMAPLLFFMFFPSLELFAIVLLVDA